MYKFLRNTHLLLGVFSCAFLLMYGVSSVQMAHNKWFNTKPTVTEAKWTLAVGVADARVVARELMDHHGLRGELIQIRKNGGKTTFRLIRPGAQNEVAYDPVSGETAVRTSTTNFMGMMNRIHHVGGVWHDYVLINLWGVMVAVISVALVILGVTGIYLWFKIHTERVIGLLLLGLSLGYSLTLMVLIRSA
ncbi:MAG: PepSY-associated TM helix domain-containing protein [Bryobacteraceae bacterium]